ncbi:MAG TPA: hypothetical protein VFH58_02215, partial [Acidimicrobiales bacterium]|nr:hypothetical protein [Acidimicrobiales bacterium]
MNPSTSPTPADPVAPSGGYQVTYLLLAVSVFVQANGIGALFPLLARIQAAHHLATWGLGVMSGASFFATLAGQVALSRFLDGR